MGRKLKIVLSDLHIGAGHAGEGSNYLEDFTVDEKLVRFLREIRQESERDQREVELIINGDLFEFLQVPAVDHYSPHELHSKEAYLDSSEKASVKRLNIIVAGHREVFNAFSTFMHGKTPRRRITIIKGNHDVNLFWSGVKGRLREVLDASGPRSSLLLFAEEFVSREKIYVEHGHQRTEKMNGYRDFLDPRLFDDLSHLYYPVGSHFVIDFFNRVERERWFVDSIKPFTTLLWYALRWDFNFAADMLTCFIRHTPALVLSDFVPGSNEVAFSLHALLRDLENEESRSRLAHRYTTEPAFRRQFHQQIQQYLSDATIMTKDEPPPAMVHVSSDPLVMGRADQEQQETALRQAAAEMARQEGASVVLFGHTHRSGQAPLATGGLYINTGCWIKDLSAAPTELWEALFKGTQPAGELPKRLPYARIDYDENNQPGAKLLDFAAEDTTFYAHGQPRPGSQPQLIDSQSGGFFERNFNWLARLFGAG